MKKFINKIKNNKVLSILSVLIIGLFFILVTRITYAYLAPVINDAQTNVAGSTDTVDDFKFELGNPLKINATPTTLKENGSNYTTSTTAKALLKANSTKKTATYNYYVYFQIASNTFTYSDGSTPEIILTVTNPNGDEVTSIDGLTYGTFNGVSGFDITTKKGLFNIANNHEITSNSSTTYTTQSWTIKITYLNLSIDQSTNFGNSMKVNVYITKNEKKLTVADVCSSEQTLSSCIVAMDGKDDTLYHHTSELANGAGDNSYRYAGANPNNFVCFGSNASPCPTDNLYRIIGVFGDNYHGVTGKQLVKLIKYDYMTTDELGTDGDYSQTYKEYGMDSTYKGTYGDGERIGVYFWNKATSTNTWSTSLLNKTNLNTNFINNIGSTWSNKIATTTWKVGGNNYGNIVEKIPSVAYQNEIINPDASNSTDNATTYSAKIGLMYASDYGFAAEPSAWTLTMGSYNNTTATSTNWMYIGLYEWTILRYPFVSNTAFAVYGNGRVDGGIAVYDGRGVRASFSLESSTTYVSGSGSAGDPIVIN